MEMQPVRYGSPRVFECCYLSFLGIPELSPPPVSDHLLHWSSLIPRPLTPRPHMFTKLWVICLIG